MVGLGLALSVLLLPQEHRRIVLADLFKNTPIANFVTVDYTTDISIIQMQDTAIFRSTFMAIDHLLSVTNHAGDRYIAIIPTEVVAGYDFDSWRADGVSNENIGFPPPQIVSLSSQTPGTIRESIAEVDYDVHIRPLRGAIELHARDIAIEQGILSQAVENAAAWYRNLAGESHQADEMERQVWTTAEQELPFIVLDLPQYPVSLSVHTEVPEMVGAEIVNSVGSPYFLQFTGNELAVRAVIQPYTRASTRELYRYMARANEIPERLVAHIYDPSNSETGGVVILNDGTHRIFTLGTNGQHTVSAVLEADNTGVASRVFSYGIYAMMRLSSREADTNEYELYLSAVNLQRNLFAEWSRKNWSSAIGMRNDIRQAGLTDIAQLLEYKHSLQIAELSLSDLPSTLPEDHRTAVTLFGLIGAASTTNRDDAGEFWRDAESFLRNRVGWTSRDMSRLHMHVIEHQLNLSTVERDHFFRQLIEQHGLTRALWDVATQDERKRLLFNEFVSDGSATENSLFWYTREGNRFLPIRDIGSALGPQIWWARQFGLSENDDGHRPAFLAEQDIWRLIAGEGTAQANRLLRDREQGVVLVVPSTRLRESLNILVFGHAGVTRIEVIQRLLAGPQVVFHDPVPLLDASVASLGLGGLDIPEFADFLNRAGQRFSQGTRVSRDFTTALEDELRRHLSGMFPMPPEVFVSTR